MMRFSISNSVSAKIPLVSLVAALSVALGVGAGSYFVASTSVSQIIQNQFAGVAFDRAAKVGEYLSAVERDTAAMASFPSTGTAVEDLSTSWVDIPDDKTKTLQVSYIETNPYDADQRYKLDAPESFLRYNFVHRRIHPELRALMLARGYDDIYLLGLDATVLYSASKQNDFATILDLSAPGSGLASAYQMALQDTAPGAVHGTDFARDGVLGGRVAAFFASAVFNPDGVKVGVLAVRIGTQALNATMQERQGLGQTGETFLIGEDYQLRTDSPFSEADDTLATVFRNEAVTSALLGAGSSATTSEYRSMPMEVQVEPVPYDRLNWAVVAAISSDEASAPVTQIGMVMLGIGAILLGLAGVLVLAFSRTITRPLSKITKATAALASGDFSVDVPGASRQDELGELSRALEIFRENGRRISEMTEAEADRIIRDQAARVEMMQVLQRSFGLVVEAATAGDFSRRVEANFPDAELNSLASSVNELVETVQLGLSETGAVLSALADANLTERMRGDYQGAFAQLKSHANAVADKLSDIVCQLQDSSQSLKTATGEILSGANDLSDRTTRQAATIEETSATMSLLSTTVGQNAERAREASSVAGTVTQTAEEGGQVMDSATEAMHRIAASSSKISNIVGMIDDIAFQTNLLALNASVEAARAGDAGKGFAVVAVEVRRLAQNAASASAEIKGLIEQSASEVLSGSKLVAEAADKLGAILTLARASSSLMNDIAQESREQAEAIEGVNSAVSEMDEATQHNAALVEEMNASIAQTEAQANQLDAIVGIFTVAGPAVQVPQAGLLAVKKAS